MQIKIPKGILGKRSILNPKLWDNHEYLHVYALDYYCVGISPVEIPEWEEVSPFHETVECKQSENFIRFTFPEKLYGFYHLREKERGFVLSGNGGIVLMIITRKTPDDDKEDE